jgi:hypothetical protein
MQKPMNYLSKTDFNTARSCPTKLYYRKQFYPSARAEDPTQLNLANEGYVVGKLATLYYPEGIEINTGNNHEAALAQTKALLDAHEEVTIFEAAIASQGKWVRIDILRKRGQHFELIEVKSKSYTHHKSLHQQGLESYLEDLCFQYWVLQEAYPDSQIDPYLFLVNKDVKAPQDGLRQCFEVTEGDKTGNFRNIEVRVDEAAIAPWLTPQMPRFLALVPVKQALAKRLPTVKAAAVDMLNSLSTDPITCIPPKLENACLNCEFSLPHPKTGLSGRQTCWGDKFDIEDLHSVLRLNNASRSKAWQKWLEQGRTHLQDLAAEELQQTDRSGRAYIQWKHTLSQEEWISDSLATVIQKVRYPLYFIDFEVLRPALPLFAHNRPYASVPFQWSCHKLDKPDYNHLTHKGFLGLPDSFPGFEFAQSLLECLGQEGTILIWSSYEKTVLKEIHQQALQQNLQAIWIEQLDNLLHQEERWLDMEKIAKNHYFHPLMYNRTSIKVVLPAVLRATKDPRITQTLAQFEPQLSLLAYDEQGHLRNPYDLLPAINHHLNNGRQININQGLDAMQSYYSLIHDSPDKEARVQALLRYCKLDTLAMWIIWQHWTQWA